MSSSGNNIDISSLGEEEKPTFIDLFAGCGGLSLGLIRAGWKGLFAIEKDRDAFKSFKHNLVNGNRVTQFDWPFWLPVAEISIEDLLTKHHENIQDVKGKATLVAGGPPCQGFSLAGLRKENDPRNLLIEKYVKFVDMVEPEFLIMENVQGIEQAFSKGKKNSGAKAYSEVIVEMLREIGYRSKWELLAARDFGVPQNRPRSFLLGVKKDLLRDNMQFDLSGVVEDARVSMLAAKGLSQHREVGVSAAISDLETAWWIEGVPHARRFMLCPDSKRFKQLAYTGPRTRYQKLLHEDMNGRSPNSMRLVNHRKETVERFKHLLEHCDRGISVSKYIADKWDIRKHSVTILDPKKPSRTITTIPDDFIHYREPRVLTVRELARLQSFPDWFEFLGKYTTGGHRRVNECPRYTQVGNAVPPFLAEAVGIAAKNMLEQIRQSSRGHRFAEAS